MPKAKCVQGLLVVGLLQACSISIVRAYPSKFTDANCKGSGVCWLPVGSGIKVMSDTFASVGTAITFDPALVGGKYAPGQTYTLGMTGKNGGRQLAGATQGTWSSQTCTCGSTTTGAYSGTWTAPGVGGGTITIGMTYGTDHANPVYTTVTDYEEGDPPTTTLPPTTTPTPQPTNGPTQHPTSHPTTTPTQRPSTSSPTTSTPTVSPTIDCVCLGLVGGDDAYCGGAYDGATLVSKQQCEADARCKFGPEVGFASSSYPECSLLSQPPTSSTPTASPVSSSPSSSPVSSSPTRAPTSNPTPQPSTSPQVSTTTTVGPTASPIATPQSTDVIFNGYITDTICLVKVNSVDFQNITTDAPKHTRACLLLDYCIASGYTLLDYDDTTQAYSAKYQIASDDVSKVVTMFNSLSCINNITVTAVGTVKGAASFANADYAGDSDFWFTQGRNETFGDVFDMINITGTCGGDISLATATTTTDPDISASIGSDTELDTGAIITVALVVVAVAVIIIVFEGLGQQVSGKVTLEETTQQTTHFGL